MARLHPLPVFVRLIFCQSTPRPRPLPLYPSLTSCQSRPGSAPVSHQARPARPRGRSRHRLLRRGEGSLSTSLPVPQRPPRVQAGPGGPRSEEGLGGQWVPQSGGRRRLPCFLRTGSPTPRTEIPFGEQEVPPETRKSVSWRPRWPRQPGRDFAGLFREASLTPEALLPVPVQQGPGHVDQSRLGGASADVNQIRPSCGLALAIGTRGLVRRR